MDGQTEDVIIMAHVETLGILLSVVHNPNGGYMVDYLTGLGVEQVAPAIITPVAANTPKHEPNGVIVCRKRLYKGLEIHVKISAFPEFYDATQ